MAQPAVTRMGWEVATAVDNLESLGVSPHDIILLWSKHSKIIPQKIDDIFGTTSYVFEDKRDPKAMSYIPSIRPYLWWQFLSKYPQYQNEDFVYQDSDVIYRQIPNFNKMPELSANFWYGGDTESYVGPDYMNSKGKDFLHRSARFLGINDNQFWSFKNHSVGAHWVISHPQANYWKDVYFKSWQYFNYVKQIEHEYDYVLQANGGTQDYWFQVWVAEMIAELYLCAKYQIKTVKSDELNFSWSTDSIEQYPKFNILHNSGVDANLSRDKKLFFKGKYVSQSPFKEDLSWVNKDYCSSIYAQHLQATGSKLAKLAVQL